MSNFIPDNEHLRHVLLFLFNQKKKAVECQRLLAEVYGEHGPSIKTCEKWLRQFKSGDFNLKDSDRSGRPKTFENADLQALLDEDDAQTEKQLAEALNVGRSTISERLKAMGKIQKAGKWVPHELNDRQLENRKTTSEILLQRHDRKSFLHRIVTGDEKWIYYENPKRKRSWVDPGQPSTSTARPNRFGKKAMLCVWWDQEGVVYHELLQPGQTVTADRYRQQVINLKNALLEKRPKWAKRHGKVILLHDNAPSHTARSVKEAIKELGWEVLPHPPYSPDLAPSDYYLFASMGHALAEQHFADFEQLKNWVIQWFASKDEQFYWRGIHKLPERWEKCVANDGQYFE